MWFLQLQMHVFGVCVVGGLVTYAPHTKYDADTY